MGDSKILIYDGSFNGFLTAVFIAFEEKIQVSEIQKNSVSQNGLFSETKTIFTNLEKAKRVWNGIQRKSNSAIKNIYFAFLSESKGVELLLFHYIKKMYASNEWVRSDEVILKINHLAKSVCKEKLHIEAFLRFQKTKDEILFANVEPDFDVLPLVSKHFRSRYANQQWLVYDAKRGYGIFYNLEKVEIISLDLHEIHASGILKKEVLSQEEHSYQELWCDYFKSTDIKSRINKKLHTQHVPKRSWKYLSEEKEAV